MPREQSKTSRAVKVQPLPGAIKRPGDPDDVQGKPWTFEESEQGSTDLANHIVECPMGTDDQSFGIRSHEMLHVALSPMPSEDMDTFTLAAEDGRIETLATRQGIKRTNPIGKTDFLAELISQGKRDDALGCAVAITGAPQESAERKNLGMMAEEYIPQAAELLDLMDWAAGEYASDPGWGSTERVAGRLRELCDAPPPSSSKGGKPGESGKDGDSSEDGKPGTGTISKPGRPGGSPARPGSHGVKIAKPPEPKPGKDDASGEVRERKSDPDAKPGRPKEVFPVDMKGMRDWLPTTPESAKGRRTGKWGRADIEYPPRPQIIVQREDGHKRSRATDYGTVPVRMHRMTIDQKVFASRKHKRQGTVLVDQSGSMSLRARDIKALIDYAPAAVVAGYWGNTESGADGTGTIRILAAGGRMVSDSDLNPSGWRNEIDGPAIAWLAAQRGPRVWVCDGGITTVGDEGISHDSPLRAQFERMRAKGRIIRVGKIGHAKKHLR